MKTIKHTIILLLLMVSTMGVAQQRSDSLAPMSTVALAQDMTHSFLYLAQHGTLSVDKYSIDKNTIVDSWNFVDPPTGITIDQNHLYVTTSYAKGMLYRIDIKNPSLRDSLLLPMGACSPTLNRQGDKLVVCNRYVNTVSLISLKDWKIKKSVPVEREPNNVIFSKDEKLLFVTNFLPYQRADIDTVAADVTVIKSASMKVVKHIKLANGSNALRDMTLSADGRYVMVSHNLGRFQVPTSQLQQGWMNTSALSLIQVDKLQHVGTVLLDDPNLGAAGTWGVACNDDLLVITHSGTHDMSVISYPDFIKKFEQTKDKESLTYDLRFMYTIRKRVPLQGNGPRELLLDHHTVYVPTYFSDIMNVYDTSTETLQSQDLNPNYTPSIVHHGEQLFNDATYCLEGWQSCNGCHPGEARTDGMNWDLLNDGVGNPKNCKSMLYSHRTAPAMITGIRPDAETAVRAGFRHIQFAKVSEKEAQAVDAYLKSLTPLPSPYLQDGKLSKKAEQGAKIFKQLNCQYCHSGPLFTDGKTHRIGEVEFEQGWDTPTLKEVWRTGPYLFDGRAKTIKEVFEIHHHGIQEGQLKKKELEALVEYIQSL